MPDSFLSITELAAAAGLSRRTVRFYVQRGLLEAPRGRGRGCHYHAGHLDQLRRILQLQTAGHSLDAISQILAGRAVEPAPDRSLSGRARPRATISARLWSRLQIADGVELHLDAAKHNLDVHALLALREALSTILAIGPAGSSDRTGEERREAGKL